MASAADPSSTSHSPRSARPSRGPSSPWSHALRGDHESPAAASSPSPPPSTSTSTSTSTILTPEPSDRSPPVSPENVASSSGTIPLSSIPSDEPEHGSNDASAAALRGKKPAWQRPSNGSIEVGPVMGGIAWPPLSLSTKASPKSSSSDTLKGSSDATVSAPPGPIISTPYPRPNSNNINLNSTPNHVAPPVRQKPSKRGGGGSSSGTPANGVPALQSPPLASAAATQISPDKETTPEPSPRDLPNKNSGSSNWDYGTRGGGFTPQQHGGNDHHRGYGSSRRGGGGGSHHGGFGSRRDQERGNYEWNHRGFSSRDASVQQRGIRPYPRPPPQVAPPFISPSPQVRPFGNPIGYPDIPSPVYYVATPPPPETLRGLPFVAHPAAPPAMFFQAAVDPQRAILLKQINYYFSSENLCKDIYLRRNMDEQGWVPISLIAGFNRVRQLANNIQYILDTVRLSDVVEVQGEKIRKRNDWMNWVLPPSPNHFGTVSGLQSPATSDYDALVSQLRNVGLEGGPNHNSMRGSTHAEVVLIRSASGNLNNQLQVVSDLSGDENGQVTGRTHSDYSRSGRSLVRSDTL